MYSLLLEKATVFLFFSNGMESISFLFKCSESVQGFYHARALIMKTYGRYRGSYFIFVHISGSYLIIVCMPGFKGRDCQPYLKMIKRELTNDFALGLASVSHIQGTVYSMHGPSHILHHYPTNVS